MDVLSDGSEFIIRAPVGYCADTGCVYSLGVTLTPMVATGTLELRFFIVEAQPDASHIAVWWDGSSSLPVISDPGHRHLIRSLMLTAVATLIDAESPDAVEMVTHTADLPDAALSKFYDIAGVFRRKGYQARRADSYHGRLIWMMRKVQ